MSVGRGFSTNFKPQGEIHNHEQCRYLVRVILAENPPLPVT